MGLTRAKLGSNRLKFELRSLNSHLESRLILAESLKPTTFNLPRRQALLAVGSRKSK